MPNHLSVLGIIHTAISILAIFAAVYALAREGKINPTNTPGKLYILLTVIACLTALPIMRTGHPTPGHPLAIIILVLLPLAIYAKFVRIFGKYANYGQTIIMSFTLFLSMIPAIVETLTRIPISHPLAVSDQDQLVKITLGIVFAIFLAGVIYQVWKMKAKKKTMPLTLVSTSKKDN